jgi:hypothetical protein
VSPLDVFLWTAAICGSLLLIAVTVAIIVGAATTKPKSRALRNIPGGAQR